MNDMTNAYDVKEAIDAFPRLKARTLRFGCGAPRSARVIGDGSRALFLRSDGPEDLVTALWMSVLEGDGSHREVLLADPRELLANADSEDVPAEERPTASVRARAAPASSATRSMRPGAV